MFQETHLSGTTGGFEGWVSACKQYFGRAVYHHFLVGLCSLASFAVFSLLHIAR